MKLEKRGDSGAPAPQKDKQDGNKPVVVYIMILFIAAFLLMALSFFMHQRSNTEALGQLQSSVSHMQEVQAIQEEVIDLQDQLAVVKDELAKAQEAAEDAQAQQAASDSVSKALLALYTLQQQYLTLDVEGCAQTIEDAESEGLTAYLPTEAQGGVTSPAIRWQQLKEAVASKLAG